MSRLRRVGSFLLCCVTAACSEQRVDQKAAGDDHDHGAVDVVRSAAGTVVPQQNAAVPASANNVVDRLSKSPRHRELQWIKTGAADSVQAWVIYPVRTTKAPVVVVVHEIFGISKWLIGVGDQAAADGYIAIVPNLLAGTLELDGDTSLTASARTAINRLMPADIHRRIAAIGQWGMSQPAAARKYGVVGFCWGGGTSFSHAISGGPDFGAAVVYYGAPASAGSGNFPSPDFSKITAPVLGLYGGADARITMTVPGTDSIMKSLKKSFEYQVFDGAAHGFLRLQGDQAAGAAANTTAANAAWPMTIAFFRKHLGA